MSWISYLVTGYAVPSYFFTVQFRLLTGYLPGDSLHSFASPAKCFFHYVHFLMHISVIRKCALGNFPGYLHYSQFVRAALATVTRGAVLAELECSRVVEGK